MSSDDDWLRDRFRVASAMIELSGPAPLGQIRTARRRPTGRWALVGASIAVCAVLAGAFGAVHLVSTGGNSAPVTPSGSGGTSTGEATTGQHGKPAPRCRGNLTAGWTTPGNPAEAMGVSVWFLIVANEGSTPCSVQGYPSVQPAARRVREAHSEASSIMSAPIPDKPVVLGPGQSAIAQVAAPYGSVISGCHSPRSWEIELPDGQHLTVGATKASPVTICDDSLIVSPLYLEGGQSSKRPGGDGKQPSAARLPPCTVDDVRVTWEKGASAMMGGGSVFTLRFQNASTRACRVEGYPAISVAGRSLKVVHDPRTPLTPGTDRARIIGLQPGQSAVSQIWALADNQSADACPGALSPRITTVALDGGSWAVRSLTSYDVVPTFCGADSTLVSPVYRAP